MLMITKRSGREEEFRPAKIRRSIRDAGVSREAALNVAGSICYHEGITTSQVRNRVIGGIQSWDPQAADRYESYSRRRHQT